MKSMARWIGLGLLALTACAAPALAAEEGGDIASSTIGWTFRWLNFAILFGGGFWLLRKAPQFFRARAARIVSAIEESKQVKAESDRVLADAERRMANLDQEVADLRTTARQDAAAEAERIRSAARDEEAKIGRAAQAEIEAAEHAARAEMKALVAQLAIAGAESMLREKVSGDQQAVWMRRFVENLGSPN